MPSPIKHRTGHGVRVNSTFFYLPSASSDLDLNNSYSNLWKNEKTIQYCSAHFTSYGSLGENQLKILTAWSLGWWQMMSTLMTACRIESEEHSRCHSVFGRFV
ncbi:hypothetical protein JRQ81_015588 [Phrynocephalus forsythii]|uniref:Uncharacterized protein n=1 Tax=Phrynocephalus forsythii TaxID=171643 RepID=A0A9Q0XW68_9SAUR|nr:hypothetical protein JRQ81_015588 [Phrynocephalus forsythii]